MSNPHEDIRRLIVAAKKLDDHREHLENHRGEEQTHEETDPADSLLTITVKCKYPTQCVVDCLNLIAELEERYQ